MSEPSGKSSARGALQIAGQIWKPIGRSHFSAQFAIAQAAWNCRSF